MQLPLQSIGEGDKHKNTGFAVSKKSLEAYYHHTERDYEGGYYPIGTNTVWHGGVHLHVPQGNYVHAIAPGMVVAVRLGEEDKALNHYGSTNFILVRHTYLSETYYCLFFHLHWEPLKDSNSNFQIIDWLKKDDGKIDKRLLSKLKSGKVYSPFKEVKEGDCLWTTGLYGSKSKRSPLIHWEIFSEKMLLEGASQVEDPDNNINCEQKYHEVFLPNFEDLNKDGNLDSGEIVKYFADTDKSKHLRNTACKFISEFAVDWDEAVKKLRKRFSIFRLANRIAPYNFWYDAIAQASRIPADPHVWHYNPITLVREVYRTKFVGDRLVKNFNASINKSPGGKCFDVCRSRLEKAYNDTLGHSLYDDIPVSTATASYSASDAFKELCKSSTGTHAGWKSLPQQFRGKGVAGAIANAGLGYIVDEEQIWKGKLQPGAVMQVWESENRYNDVVKGADVNINNEIGHSFFFLEYIRNTSGQITGIRIADQGYQNDETLNRGSWAIWIGANITVYGKVTIPEKI